MVGKNSEYRRSYQQRNGDYLRESYGDNLDYRTLRRKTECWHSMDPFTWDEKDLRDVPSDINVKIEERRPPSVPLFQYKHEKFNKEYEEKHQQKGKLHVAINGHQSGPGPLSLQQVGPRKDSLSPQSADSKISKVTPTDESGTPPLKLDLRTVLEDSNGRTTPVTRSSDTEEEDKENKSSVKPKNPKNKVLTEVPRCRPSSAPAKRVAKPLPHRAPFVAYGCKDCEPETARKKTHNIRASADIYPSAIRAQKRREAQVERRKKETPKITFLESQKAQFLAKMQRETSCWDTEYRSNFAGYENNVYQNNLANRLNPRRVWQVLYAP